MKTFLAGLARKCCLVYLDDVLVFGRSLDEHNENLSKVFKRLRAAGLKLKPKKCRIAMMEVVYLGHLSQRRGLEQTPGRSQQFRSPTFISGLASYYRRFVPGFASVTRLMPLGMGWEQSSHKGPQMVLLVPLPMPVGPCNDMRETMALRSWKV